MAAFERLSHQLDVADALEAIVRATVRKLDQLRNQLASERAWIDEVGHAELARDRFTTWVDVDAHDRVCAGEPRALNHVQADPAEPEHDHVGARLYLCRVQDCTDPGRHAAAD